MQRQGQRSYSKTGRRRAYGQLCDYNRTRVWQRRQGDRYAACKRTGDSCYAQQLIDMASEYSGINKQLFAEVDEKLRGSYLMKHLIKIPYTYVVEPSDKEFTSDINLFNIQSEMIRELARTESCVVIGKCADYILREEPNVISVYVEAPEKDCIATVMDRMQVTESRAKELVHKTDKYRSDYYRYYTRGRDWKMH